MTAQNILSTRGEVTKWFPLTILIAAGAVFRAITFANYTVPSIGDISTYFQMAEILRSLDLGGYQGYRPPLYPALLAITGENLNLIWTIQAILGLATSVVIYRAVTLLGVNRWWGVLAGFAYSMNLSYVLVEASVMSEPLATFLVALAMLGLAQLIVSKDFHPKIFLLMGLAIGLAGATRPGLFALAPVVAGLSLLIPYARTRQWRIGWKAAAIFSIPVFVCILAVSSLNKAGNDRFVVSTQTGLSLANVIGSRMELASDEHKEVRDIFVAIREKQIENTGSASGTIWQATSAMGAMNARVSEKPLSSVLISMATDVIRADPAFYLKEVWYGFKRHFGFDVVYGTDTFKSPDALRIYKGLIRRQKVYHSYAAQMFWLSISAMAVAAVVFRKRNDPSIIFVLGTATAFIVTAWTQSMFDNQSSERFAQSINPLMFTSTVVGIAYLATAFIPRVSTLRTRIRQNRTSARD